MRIFIISVSILLANFLPAFGSVEDFTRAVSDPVDSLIYPQQIIAGIDDKVYIIDTISNSAHLKIYSSKGDFARGLLPAGVGESAVKFDLGLTLISGKNIVSISDDGKIFLLDNEDGWSVIKSFDQAGNILNIMTIGHQSPDSSYGALAVDKEKLYFEYDDQIFVTDSSLKRDFQRIIGKRGEAIDNWDLKNGRLVTLVENELTIFNENAIPITALDISDILTDAVSLIVYDISISNENLVAVGGLVLKDDNQESYFIFIIDRFGKLQNLIYPDDEPSSFDWGLPNNLRSFSVSENKAVVAEYSSSLERKSTFTIPLQKPVLAHPNKITISDDGAIWVDNQRDFSNLIDPFSLLDSTVLTLRQFKNNSSSEFSLERLKTDRFASIYLGCVNNSITLSGIRTDSEGIPLATTVYKVFSDESQTEIKVLENLKYLLLASVPERGKSLFLDPDSGDVYEGTLNNSEFSADKKIINAGEIESGIPEIIPFDEKHAFFQLRTAPEMLKAPICLYDFDSQKIEKTWRVSEYIDLQILHSSGSDTAVVYWFPQGLLRINSDFKVIGWIDLGDDAAYNFISGCYKNNTNYILDARYNLVYSFNNHAWERIDTCSLDDVRQNCEKMRSLIGTFYNMNKKYPEKLTDIVDFGIINEKDLLEIFKVFLGESPVFYKAEKFDYALILWGKDKDSTLFKANSKGLEAI